MKRSLMIAVLSLLLIANSADAVEASAPSGRKDCEELKQEIAARIEANGVRQYQLQIVEPEAEQVGRIVGSCNGGSRHSESKNLLALPRQRRQASHPSQSEQQAAWLGNGSGRCVTG